MLGRIALLCEGHWSHVPRMARIGFSPETGGHLEDLVFMHSTRVPVAPPQSHWTGVPTESADHPRRGSGAVDGISNNDRAPSAVVNAT
jgi:hypothetical protein